ncbi:uncharacterized protein FOMMEDRAFT_142261 [Fomitiporia mediterranea MF3/22]|uniref:uncharacterized protein n=1 Tax=Fomitiporia mediterranea (strain MF3/22) TaxID=694068 RepID=UPI00044074AE|nr:uncharacterized protein FOMMEDRAFT_142261 [Fomitiporia mediterranea MF3/22]EJD01730.1 hypothetical protein FOMMEDRAFT_142261 [Fomitiporia mediterranea MF3/22]
MASERSFASTVRPYSQSPWPAWSLASLFLASSALPPGRFPKLPPFPQRAGFSLIMYGAGYVLSTGDSLNGSGISTAWSLTYLFWNARRSFTTLRSPVSMVLTGATAICAGLYGTEYFILQDKDTERK